MSDPTPPPQVSPDGKFYWDGQKWVPMQAPPGPSSPPQQLPQSAPRSRNVGCVTRPTCIIFVILVPVVILVAGLCSTHH
jgi:hypothetical protein